VIGIDRDEPLDVRLDLVAKLRQESVWPRVLDVATGRATTAPIVVELDPTSFCDLACEGCISLPLLRSGRFTGPRLQELAEEIASAGVLAVILIGGGEPLLHPSIASTIRSLAEAGLDVGLTTNGTQIDRHIDAISDFVTWTRVSVDAGSEAVYRTVRPSRHGRNEFTHVIDNMRLLAKTKRGALGYSFLLQTMTAEPTSTSNTGDIVAAAELAKAIGCDYFEVKPSYDMGHFLYDRSRELSELIAQLDAARSLSDNTFEVITPNSIDAVSHGERIQAKTYATCPVAQLRTLITPSGAYICPYHRGNERARYGDPVDESFVAMWRSAKRADVLNQVNPSHDCKFHCIRHQSNLEIITAGSPDNHAVVADFDLFI
jgi:MoaA/NifB/PqqE/SkfB family radical SAM enzyme